MRTKQTIVGIVLAIVLAAVGVLVGLMVWLGPWLGLGTVAAAAVAIFLLYVLVIAPWQHRWGATDDEVAQTLPGMRLSSRMSAASPGPSPSRRRRIRCGRGWCRSV